MHFILIFLFLFSKSNGGEVATTKCKEYGKAVYSEEDNPTLSRSSATNTVSGCGIVSVPLIIGGVTAQTKEFPHMAVIGFGDSPDSELKWECGGSLVSDLFVLTAAHCVKSREVGLAQKVMLGIINLEDLDVDTQKRTIVDRITHPDYIRAEKINDIALLKMETPVEFTPFVRPACLNSIEIPNASPVLATGFGKLAYEATSGSKDLMKVTLHKYDINTCRKNLKIKGLDSKNVLCAGELNGGKDTCQGDSGGPLQIVLRDPYCMYSLIGVTSFGKFCGFPNSPAIYTMISAYIPWIESIVW